MSNYKIVRLAPASSCAGKVFDILANLYSDFTNKTYNEQLDVYLKNKFSYSDGFSCGMRLLGHDTVEIVYDFLELQKKWALENNISYEDDSCMWKENIVLAQLKNEKPDILFIQGFGGLSFKTLGEVKKLIPSIKKIVLHTGYPGFYDQLKDIDILFVAIPRMVDQYKIYGCKPHLIYHYFNKEIYNRLMINNISNNRKYDLSFVGSSGYGHGRGHQKRYWDLVDLIKKTEVNLWIDDNVNDNEEKNRNLKLKFREFLINNIKRFNTDLLKNIHKFNFHSKIDNLIKDVIKQKMDFNSNYPSIPLKKIFPCRCKMPVYGVKMFEIIKETKILLNSHTGAAVDNIGNIRMFEATGVGSCLLTDDGVNMADLFEGDSEIVTYKSVEECIEKVNYLLEHKNERKAIALAGQKRTLKDHTNIVRCQQMDEIIQKTL